MFKIGLCSVTFRDLPVEKVIEAAKKAEIDGIEWGGDYHISPGDFEQAKRVASLTKEAGLEVTSYGSYYRLGNETGEAPFDTVLETAIKLGSPSIRVWAGDLGSDEATDSDYRTVTADAKRIADAAEEKGILINLEYHGKTLTDTAESAVRLMKEINHPNVCLYWQPALFESPEERAQSIDKVTPWLIHVHVFHWKINDGDLIMYPLSDGVSDWKTYLSKLKIDEGERYLMLEFVKDGKVEQFLEDAGVLKSLIY